MPIIQHLAGVAVKGRGLV